MKAAAKAEKEANKKKSDLRLAAMHQSRAGKRNVQLGTKGSCRPILFILALAMVNYSPPLKKTSRLGVVAFNENAHQMCSEFEVDFCALHV